jgi:hypothetical protein
VLLCVLSAADDDTQTHSSSRETERAEQRRQHTTINFKLQHRKSQPRKAGWNIGVTKNSSQFQGIIKNIQVSQEKSYSKHYEWKNTTESNKIFTKDPDQKRNKKVDIG